MVKANPAMGDDEMRRLLAVHSGPNTREEVRSEINRLKMSAHRKFLVVDALKVVEGFESDEALLRIDRNDCSRLHKLEEAMRAGDLFNAEAHDFVGVEALPLVQGAAVFVLSEDWAAVVQDIGEVSLPAPHCAFEMVIGGVPVIFVSCQIDTITACQGFVLAGDMWIAMGTLGETSNLLQYARNQAIAALIALDAEVATHEVIRQPAALNAKRAKSGKTPLYDFHVVNLAKRHRAVAGPTAGHSGRHVRLHFRRGHWRHFESHKTWIKWMLVGDPALGVVGKEYRL
jgi:hypothetical protein